MHQIFEEYVQLDVMTDRTLDVEHGHQRRIMVVQHKAVVVTRYSLLRGQALFP